MRVTRERRKPTRFQDENDVRVPQASANSTRNSPVLPSKRTRKKPQRFEDEIIPSLPKKKRKEEIITNTVSKVKEKVPIQKPAKPEIRTFQASGSMNARKTKQGNSYVVKSKVKTIIDISDTEVYVQTATAAQIRAASKKKYRPTKADKNSLIQIPSHMNRAKIYLNASKAIARKESRALPSHGARPWFCQITLSDQQGAMASSSNYDDDVCEVEKADQKGKMATSPLFVWNKYHLELAALPNIISNIDEIDTNHGLLKSVQEEVTAMQTEDGYITDDDDYINHLVERDVTVLSTIASNDSNYVIPSIDRKWTSPDLLTFRSRNAAVQHSLMLLDRDKVIDRVMYGIGSRGALLRPVKPTRKLALEAGFWRFLRDGLWVVGQEESWIEARIEYLKQKDEAVEVATDSDNKGFDCENKEGSERSIHSTKYNENDEEKNEKHNKDDGVLLISNSKSNDSQKDGEEISSMVENKCNGNDVKHNKDDGVLLISNSKSTDSPKKGEEISSTAENKCNGNDGNHNKDDGVILISNSKPMDSPREGKEMSSTVENLSKNISIDGQHAKVLLNEKNHPTDLEETASTAKKVVPSWEQTKKSRNAVKKGHQYSYVSSTHWRLTSKQIDMCYNAVMDFYESVMYTVKAKALYPELADGFDVFRERGRGRFDMTLSAFDNPEFNFLTDLDNAAWMTIVKKILGDEVSLVHKGAFLSTPGAETQIYHQDGVHLNKKYQKPCHAINVFIPLVDLTEKNGPTEFCIGTHHLGYESYNKELIDTPLASKGVPIIFDYRLGHRGLGNNSQEPRPVIYLTYTRKSKEFRDAVNFSSKRYRKLGELVKKPISRNERALKRTSGS